jgi:hypothetical protein
MDNNVSTAVLTLTGQEQKIINYLAGKNEVAWEELVVFAKDPQRVKLKTLQKVVSDIKRKFKDMGLTIPFACTFKSISAIDARINKELEAQVEPAIVRMRTTPGGNKVPASNTDLDAHIDFKLEKLYKRVRTRSGLINLSDNEWELFSYLHENAGKMVSLEDMKSVVYKSFGSRTPYNWADAIKRTLTKLRTNIKELKSENRLVTIIGGNTVHYMLQ